MGVHRRTPHRRQVSDTVVTMVGVVAVLAVIAVTIVGALYWPGP